jgi:hypothetical protein
MEKIGVAVSPPEGVLKEHLISGETRVFNFVMQGL